MTITNGHVVPTPNAEHPYMVVLEHDQHNDSEYPVASVEEGEALIKARSAPAEIRTVSTIERALQLARSGECRTLEEVRTRLRREGFGSVESHTSGSSIKAQLKKLMAGFSPPGD